MPYVSIRVAGSLTTEQKEKLCAEVTEAIVRVTGKPRNSILIFLDEVAHENIASGGVLLQKPSS